MKTPNIRETCGNILLISLVNIGGLGCLSTAFSLSVELDVLILVCLIWSLLCCLCMRSRLHWLLLPATLALFGFILWHNGLESHTESILWNISKYYDQSYGLGFTLWWTSDNHLGKPATLFFLALASLNVWLSCLGLCRYRRMWPAVLVSVFPLLPCLAVPDAAPDATFFFLLLLGISVLALSRLLRRRKKSGSGNAVFLFFLPTALALLLIFVCIPQSSFDSTDVNSSLQAYLQQIIEHFSPGQSNGPSISGVSGSRRRSLTTVGPKALSRIGVCSLQTDYNGRLYLRETNYDIYSGTAWSVSVGEADSGVFQAFLSDEPYEVTIFTGVLRHYRYLVPYYNSGGAITDGVSSNDKVEKQYWFSFSTLTTDWETEWRALYGARLDLDILAAAISGNDYLNTCLQLPEDTYAAARQLLVQNGLLDGNVLDVAQAIESFVQKSATYDLNTPKMPAEHTDFAIWFLTEQDTGYCVHFASAATVLLRAAGIPARYVEGYAFVATSDQSVNVSEADAHAWVEYYLPEVGWLILDATPAQSHPDPTDPPTDPPTEPSSDVTTAPTPTTEPTEPSTDTTPSDTSASEPSVPSNSAPVNPSDPIKPASGVLKALGRGLTIVASVLIFIILQWRLRLLLRKKYLSVPDPNRQALRLWRNCLRYSRLLKTALPPELEELAKKARFSQHVLAESELSVFRQQAEHDIAQMRQAGFLRQLYYRIILAIY